MGWEVEERREEGTKKRTHGKIAVGLIGQVTCWEACRDPFIIKERFIFFLKMD